MSEIEHILNDESGLSVRNKLNENTDYTNYNCKYLAAMSIEQQSLSIRVDTGKVYMDVEAVGGGDMHYFLNTSLYTLNCTSGEGVAGKATIELTQGTSSDAFRNFVYVTLDDDTAELRISPVLPTGDLALVSIVTIQDAAGVASNGAIGFQRVTESIMHNDRGAISWMREKLRFLGATWISGVDSSVEITTNLGSEDDVCFCSTSGIIQQLHRQNFPSLHSDTDGIYVANASGNGTLTTLQKLSNLNQIHEIQDGTAIVDGDCICLTIGGVVNHSESNCKLFVGLPSAKYTNETDAIRDIDKTAADIIPFDFQTNGFFIGKLVLKYTSADNGTWTNLLVNSVLVWASESADISSPNYPLNYPADQDVTSTLTKAGYDFVRVHFDDFVTEATYDFVRLYNGADVLQATYDGTLSPFTSVDVSGDTVKIRFTSDGTVQRKGFHIDSLEYGETVSSGAEVKDLRGVNQGWNR